MAVLQLATSLRTAMAALIETDIGPSPRLDIFDGTMPANCGVADAGTKLASMTLPADWASQANGVLSLLGVWQDLLADAAGDAKYWRIYTSGGTCKGQGDCSLPAGTGSLKLINTNLAINQPVSITTFDLTMGNA